MATALTTPTCCKPAGRLVPLAVWPKSHLPEDLHAQPPVGPCATIGSGEPGSAGPDVSGWSWASDGPLTIDLDFPVCETHRLAKEGARRRNYPVQRGHYPLLSITACQHQIPRNLIEAKPRGWTPPPTGWTVPPTCLRPNSLPWRVTSSPHPCPHCPLEETQARLPTCAVRQLQLPRLHHQPGG